MTLDNLATPFERRRVIEYGKDGNKVVRHWYDVQHVIGSLCRSKEFPNNRGELEFKLFVFFDDKCDGLQFEWLSHPERYTVEQVADTMRRCRVDSMTHMYLELNDRMGQNKFIGNAQIEFIRQFDSAAADRYAQYREDFYTRKAEQERAESCFFEIIYIPFYVSLDSVLKTPIPPRPRGIRGVRDRGRSSSRKPSDSRPKPWRRSTCVR